LPTGSIPIKTLPPTSDYDGLFEGGNIIEDYETVAAQMATLHDEWREVTLEWSNRMDQLFAQNVVLERTLRDQGSAPPVEDFDEVASDILGFYFINAYGLGQGIWSASEPLRRKIGRTKAKTQSIGIQMDPTPGTATRTVQRELLKKANPEAARVAKSVSKGVENGNLIAEPIVTPGEANVDGAAGCILEMQAAVDDIHHAIRTLPHLEGIARKIRTDRSAT
jgi:hypothetical protein